MVEISLYGSGEGSGWVTAPGYSTAAFQHTQPSSSVARRPMSRAHGPIRENPIRSERIGRTTSTKILQSGIASSTGTEGC